MISGLIWPERGLAQDKENNMILVEGANFLKMPELRDGPGPEKPARQVMVKSFYIGKYEVTFAEYGLFCLLTGRQEAGEQGWGRGQYPVSNVSWQDAVDYCNWLSELEGLNPAYSGKGIKTACDFMADGYRLPTEIEWEYAAKGGQKSGDYKYSGSNNADTVAWHIGNAGQMTHPVGGKQANELGIYDMSGNVSEWCWDGYYWYDKYGPPERSLRAYRGGSWRSDVYISAADITGLDMKYSYIGFRLVRSTQSKF